MQMNQIDIIFKIAGIGILTAVLHSVLKSMGKEDQAALAALAGLAIVLFMVIDQGIRRRSKGSVRRIPYGSGR